MIVANVSNSFGKTYYRLALRHGYHKYLLKNHWRDLKLNPLAIQITAQASPLHCMHRLRHTLSIKGDASLPVVECSIFCSLFSHQLPASPNVTNTCDKLYFCCKSRTCASALPLKPNMGEISANSS